jgi:hypothetical protein
MKLEEPLPNHRRNRLQLGELYSGPHLVRQAASQAKLH